MEKSISVSSILWKNELRVKNLVYLFDIISIDQSGQGKYFQRSDRVECDKIIDKIISIQ